MAFSAALRGNLILLSQCASCSNIQLQPNYSSSPSSAFFLRKRSHFDSHQVSRVLWKRAIVCRVADTETEPDGNDDKEKEEHQDVEMTTTSDSPVQDNTELDSKPITVDQIENGGADTSAQAGSEVLQTSSGSPVQGTQLDSQPITPNQIESNGADTSAQAGTEVLQTSSDSPVQDNTQLDSQPITTNQIENGAGTSAQAGTEVLQTSSDTPVQDNTQLDSQPIITNQTENNGAGTSAQAGTEDVDNVEVASGSPLPGMKLGELERIPKETVDILKDQVFGFDTFFVTGQEPYEGGMLFKGNLRGKAATSYEKIVRRMENKFGDKYKLFLLVNPQDDKPVAVVVPRKTLQPETTAVPEWFAAASFGLVSIFTLLLRNVPALQSDLLSTFDNIGLLTDGLPGALVTALVLGIHELGHILVAKNSGIKLGVPFFVPSWQIGSFGAITRIVNIVPKREDLLKVAAAGPLAGFSLGLTLLLLGFFLPPSDGIGVVVDGSVFHESLLAGGIAKLLLGDALKDGTPISLNPLVIWAWAGLLINAINSIPAGELDGGRIAFSIWGRKTSTRLTGASIVLLGISSLFNDVAFYWVALIFFLQRGPIAPLAEEISDPDDKYISLGVLVLILGLLVCLPYPFPFTVTDEAFSSF